MAQEWRGAKRGEIEWKRGGDRGGGGDDRSNDS